MHNFGLREINTEKKKIATKVHMTEKQQVGEKNLVLSAPYSNEKKQ